MLVLSRIRKKNLNLRQDYKKVQKGMWLFKKIKQYNVYQRFYFGSITETTFGNLAQHHREFKSFTYQKYTFVQRGRWFESLLRMCLSSYAVSNLHAASCKQDEVIPIFQYSGTICLQSSSRPTNWEHVLTFFTSEECEWSPRSTAKLITNNLCNYCFFPPSRTRSLTLYHHNFQCGQQRPLFVFLKIGLIDTKSDHMQ
jgi:hypothetical protein